MTHPNADVIDAFWARRLGCLPGDIRSPGVHVVCSGDVDPGRMAVLQLDRSTIVRASSEHEEPLTLWARNRSEDSPRSAEAVAQALADQEWTVGPSEKVLYLDPAEFRPADKPGVRQLTRDDSWDLTAMHRGCTLQEQQAGEVNIDHPAIFGAYAGEGLVAAASFIDQGEDIADVGVLVHCDYRRQGYGRAVVSALARWGLDNGRIVQYWRLCSNTGSVRLADALGFQEYGRYQNLTLNIPPFGW